MQELKDKKILFLAPKFFGYELEIKKELEKLGANVIYFDERPKNNFFTKVLIRLNFKKLIINQIDHYYENIIEYTKEEKFNYLFLINPETIDYNKIEKLKNIHNNITVIVYFWDSIKNKKNALMYLRVSDRFFTFDLSDKDINNNINFLPLFYIEDYKIISNIKQNLIYDISFIGTIHSDRFKIINKIKKQLEKYNFHVFICFYSPSKILFLLQKIFNKDFRIIKWKDVTFKALDKKKVVYIIKNSKVLIDIQHPNQNGLTMRTIEAIGAKRKLITTNSEVLKYDFYNENNFLIMDRNNPVINESFINNEYYVLDKEIYLKYSLNGWLKNIFAINENSD